MDEPARAACHYCGLPVASYWSRSLPPADEPLYCCYGCELAEEITGAQGGRGAVSATLAKLCLAIFLTMNVMVLSLSLWSQEFVPAGSPGAYGPTLLSLFRYLCLLFATPVLLLLGMPLADSAFRSALSGRPSTDLLLAAGVLAAFGYSVITTIAESGHVYFDVACMVLVMVTLGRWLEARGRLRTTEAVESLADLLPETALVVDADNERSLPLDQIAVGDHVRVLPGETIPLDGRIQSSEATVNEQLLTGESMPIVKRLGDRLHAGSVAIDGEIHLCVTASHSEGTIARLRQTLREACESRGLYQRIADRVSAWFIPLVALLAAGTFAFHTWDQGLGWGIRSSLAVVLIACPCALGLATPLAIWSAMGRAARQGVLFRSGESLERLAGIKAMRFDKTGTITTGKASVADDWIADGERSQETLGLASVLARRSKHPLASAIARHLERETGEAPGGELTQVTHVLGLGMTGTLAATGERLLLGSGRFVAERLEQGEPSNPFGEEASDEATVVYFADRRGVRAAFLLVEEVRPGARETLAHLVSDGIDVAILTGDERRRAEAMGRQLGVPVEGRLLPEMKLQAIERTRERYGPTAMVGDGINDAAALIASDVGIAMGGGADLLRANGDVCLLTEDLSRLPWAIGLARATVRTIRRNLVWAFAYNIVALGFAVTGRLNPIIAAVAMVLSSAMVVASSLRLRSARLVGERDQGGRPGGTGGESSGHAVGDRPSGRSRKVKRVSWSSG
ncbi:putative copper-importing P-type ATPase A [Planctomycetes bacterium Pan216]|uniref:Putative copper-importing P-type ATPase A n=1 Tax=Kolteria novifilia TaxID=2527975 RepID=A0A518B7N0_9BACT|nr:putative copper-importing P-type ATPase A [Planctomycetes bacterium Pan216]